MKQKHTEVMEGVCPTCGRPAHVPAAKAACARSQKMVTAYQAIVARGCTRKAALAQIMREYRVCRRTVYNHLKRWTT